MPNGSGHKRRWTDFNAELPICNCVVKNRREGEEEREWFKRWMCMFHWMQTDYYRNKLKDEMQVKLDEIL